MNIAYWLVDQLLETVRACVDCEKEFNVPTLPGASHGYCRRHAMQRYAADLGQTKAQAMLGSKPDDYFSPDMARGGQV